MKNLILILILNASLFGCAEENSEAQNTSIYGRWQLVEIYDGGSVKPNQTIEDGYLYVFHSNQSFSSSRITGCPNDADIQGTFSLSTYQTFDILTLSIECDEQGSEQVMTDAYAYSINGNMLTLSPKESTCDEGCYEKFKKIADEETLTD